MNNLRAVLVRWARIAGYVGVLAIVGLSLVPVALRPSTGAPKSFEHALAYFIVAALLTATTRARWPQVMAVGLIALAAVLEFSQQWVPGRDATLIDFFGSSSGALLGAGFAALVLSRIPRPRDYSD